MLYPRFCSQQSALRRSTRLLLCRHLSQPCRQGWPCVASRVLPDAPAPLRRDRTGQGKPPNGQTHSPCSPLHARLAGTVAGPAGRLLPYPFTPGRFAPEGLLSVAVVVTAPLPAQRPHLLFREAAVPARLPRPGGSREVPLPDSAGSDDSHCPGLLTCANAARI